MEIDFNTLDKVFNKDSSVFDSKISVLALTASCAKIFSQFPKNDDLDFHIAVISNYINENPTDTYIKGQVFSMLSHTGVLIQHLDKPEIVSIFEDYHSSIEKSLSNMLNHYKNVSVENMSDNAKVAKSNLENTLNLLSSINPSGKGLNLPDVPGFLPEEISKLPCNKLNEVLSNPNHLSLIQSDLLRHVICNGGSSVKDLKSDLKLYSKAIKSFSDDFVEENAIAVNIGCLLSDVVTAKNRFGSELDTGTKLWGSVKRYTLEDIRKADFADCRHDCKEILEKFPNSKEALFVLTQDGELLFSPVKQNGKFIQHIMVANGKPVLNAGMAYFNEDMKMVAITNSSGHYKPTIDRMEHSYSTLLEENQSMLIVDHTLGTEYKLKDLVKAKIDRVLADCRTTLTTKNKMVANL